MKFLIILAAVLFSAATLAAEYYVTTDGLNVRLAPSTKGEKTNTLYSGQKVSVHEFRDGWARVSPYYDGLFEGKAKTIARWVYAKYLSEDRPIKPTVNKPDSVDPQLFAAIKNSDDFHKYSDKFLDASKSLVDSGKCSLEDLANWGGWTRSTNKNPAPVYFTYCGKASDRMYLNAKTGDVFK